MVKKPKILFLALAYDQTSIYRIFPVDQVSYVSELLFFRFSSCFYLRTYSPCSTPLPDGHLTAGGMNEI